MPGKHGGNRLRGWDNERADAGKCECEGVVGGGVEEREEDRHRAKTSAKIAKTIARNVDATAASCGLFPNGAATKNDQLASPSPSRRWTTIISPTFVAVKMRKCQMMATMIHAGRYASDILMCHELRMRKSAQSGH